MNYVIAIYMHMYYIERSVNISTTRITRVNNVCFCYVAISNDISTQADFQVTGYHGCPLVILIHNTLKGEIRSVVHELQGLKILYPYSPSFNDTFSPAKIQGHWFCGY